MNLPASSSYRDVVIGVIATVSAKFKHMEELMYSREDRIRKEAASQAIKKTIRLMGMRLNIQFPSVGTPTEDRDLMIEIIKSRMR